MTWQNVFAFLNVHKESLTLFALAVIVTMRPRLPWPFNKVDALEWLYEWIREALLTFVSLRGPARSESLAQEKIVTDETGKVTQSSVKVESSVTPATTEKSAEPDKGH